MKQLGQRAAKIFFYLTYVMILIALVISVVFNYLQREEINKINDQFIQARDELNADNTNKELTIADLKAEFENLNNQVAELETENASLEADLAAVETAGIGSIAGKIFPVVSGSGSGGFDQYQTICARNLSDRNLQFCRSVSALDQEYVLHLPVGNYQVYAELTNIPTDSELYGVRAFYTQYVKCSQQNGSDNCEKARQNRPLEVKVNAGKVTENVDPIDWR